MTSLLILVPYEEIYPPVNGGMQRCFHIIIEAAKYFKVTVIIDQAESELRAAEKIYPQLANVKIVSTRAFKKSRDFFSLLPLKFQNALRYRWYKKSLFGKADGSFLQYYGPLKQTLLEQKFDVVLLEKLSSINAVSVIRQYNKTAKVVYDAHNVDSKLAFAENNSNAPLIQEVEAQLYQQIDAAITCSQKDLQELNELNQHRLKMTVIPNGVAIGNSFNTGVKKESPDYILFCGSLGYGPNTDGLLWFYNDMWPHIKTSFPGLKLLVVGSGGMPDTLGELVTDESVIFTGRVPDVKLYYDQASVVVVPLKTGSGTRLKVLEAMALGVPMVSTSKGAEGIDYTDNETILIADDAHDFAKKTNQLLSSINQRIAISDAAGLLAEDKYNWVKIGVSFQEFINDIVTVS